MQKSLKYTRDTLNSIEILKSKHEYLGKELIRVAGQDLYEQTSKYYDNVISKLTEEMRLLPIGYRYSGTFYLKKPYTVPIEFEKIEGSIFMREDLVSWQIESNGSNQNQTYAYHRSVFKKPELNTEIRKEDGVPVYK
jgi:hypothetical protein